MTPPPEPRKPLAKWLLALHERFVRLDAGELQAYLDRVEQRRDRKERRFARRDWIWLAFMVLIAGTMIRIQLAGNRELLIPLAVVFSCCFLAYLMALYSRRRIAARDEVARKNRKLDG